MGKRAALGNPMHMQDIIAPVMIFNNDPIGVMTLVNKKMILQ